jgi:acyl-CoA thioesterase-1
MIARLVLVVLSVWCGSVLAAPAPVLVFGDSLSSAHHIAVESGWVHLLELRLRASKNPRPVVNASISGETTAGGVQRLPKILPTRSPRSWCSSSARTTACAAFRSRRFAKT